MRQTVNRYIICISIMTLITYILSFSGLIKYFLTGFLLVVLIVKKNKIIVDYRVKVFIPFLIYTVIGTLICIINSSFSQHTLRMYLFAIVPFIYGYILSELFNDNKLLLNSSFCATVINYAIFERLASESQYAFIFGAYFIYYFLTFNKHEKYRLLFAVIAFILTLLFCDKRLAVVLMMLGPIVYFIEKILLRNNNKENNINKHLFISWFLVMILTIYYLYLCKNDYLFYLMTHYNLTVSGREMIYRIFSKFYSISPLFIGRGCGWTYNQLAIFKIKHFANLHNDLMMSYIDLGFIGYIVWFISFSKIWKNVYSKKKKIIIFSLLLYTIGNYFTDNIMIYINYWMPFYIIMFNLTKEESVN